MELGLNARAALVVGATGGIGQAICRALVREGVERLALGTRSPDKATGLLEDLSGEGRTIVVVECDLDDTSAPERCVNEAIAQLGAVDILVMCAGAAPNGDIWQLEDAEIEKGIRTKLLGSMRLVRAAGPQMMERGWGRVVLIGGMHGRAPAANAPLGGMINSGIANLVGSLSKRMAGEGVTVNGIDPAHVRTPRWEKRIAAYREETGASDEEAVAHFRKNAPSPRMTQPEEVADLVAFLVSERAQSITGTPLAIDGGSNPALH